MKWKGEELRKVILCANVDTLRQRKKMAGQKMEFGAGKGRANEEDRRGEGKGDRRWWEGDEDGRREGGRRRRKKGGRETEEGIGEGDRRGKIGGRQKIKEGREGDRR